MEYLSALFMIMKNIERWWSNIPKKDSIAIQKKRLLKLVSMVMTYVIFVEMRVFC